MDKTRKINDDDLDEVSGGKGLSLKDTIRDFTDFNNEEACRALIGKFILYDTDFFGKDGGILVNVVSSNGSNAFVLDTGITIVLGFGRTKIQYVIDLEFNPHLNP